MAIPSSIDSFYEFGPFRLSKAERILLRHGEVVPTTRKQFEILLLLVENRGHVVDRERLIEEIWPDTVVEEGNLTTYISTLRKVLGEDTKGNQYIQTLPRRGYRFVGEVREIVSQDPQMVVREQVDSSIVGHKDEASLPRTTFIEPNPLNKPRMLKVAMALASVVVVTAALVVVWLRGHPTAGSNGSVRLIAVLPFKPLSPDIRSESLELGMADTLITKLSLIREIVVRPVSAVRKYSALDQDPIAAGRELKVDAVLDGSIQEANDRVRITVRLTRVADGRPLWVDQFDERMTDILSVQDSISAKVTSALAVRLTSEDKRLLTKRYTSSPEAYKHYIMGRFFWNKRTEEAMGKAIDYFLQAVENDANYALAYSGLADAYALLGNYLNRPDEFHPKSLEAAKKSVEIDDSLAEAHTSLGYLLTLRYDWQRAEAEFKRALELNPNYSTAHHWYSRWLLTLGRVDDALGEIKRAQELDPTSLIINVALGGHYYSNRMFDEAIEQLGKTLEMDPHFAHTHGHLAPAYIKKGMTEKAIAEYEKAVELSGDTLYRSGLAYAYAISGRRTEAQRILDELVAQSKRGYIWPGEIALVYAGLNDKDRFFQWFEKAYQDNDLTVDALIAEPLFDPFVSDPRFGDLILRIRARNSL